MSLNYKAKLSVSWSMDSAKMYAWDFVNLEIKNKGYFKIRQYIDRGIM